jgi:hypothetical protein
MGYNKNTGGFPFYLYEGVAKGFEVKNFVETGTAGGGTITEAAKKFENCFTIEIVEDRVPQKKQIIVVSEEDPTIVDYPFIDIEYPKNIKFFTGNSSEILYKLSIDKNEFVFFWLDAHYSDEIPADENVDECPIIKEIESIKKYEKAIIFIDDARLFLGNVQYPLNPAKWPTLQEVFDTLRKTFPNHLTTIIDDYIISVPSEMIQNFNNYWIETYKERYP